MTSSDFETYFYVKLSAFNENDFGFSLKNQPPNLNLTQIDPKLKFDPKGSAFGRLDPSRFFFIPDRNFSSAENFELGSKRFIPIHSILSPIPNPSSRSRCRTQQPKRMPTKILSYRSKSLQSVIDANLEIQTQCEQTDFRKSGKNVFFFLWKKCVCQKLHSQITDLCAKLKKQKQYKNSC